MPDFTLLKRTFEVVIEQFVDPTDDVTAQITEEQVQAGLHRTLDGEFDLGAITVKEI